MKRSFSRPRNVVGVGNKNRPGGRLHLPTVLIHPITHKLCALKQATLPAQGRGQDHVEGTDRAAYAPIHNEPRTNTPVIAEQRKALPGLIEPSPLSRQQRRALDRLHVKAARVEAMEAQRLAGINRPRKEKHNG